jgi:hypothetical protein
LVGLQLAQRFQHPAVEACNIVMPDHAHPDPQAHIKFHHHTEY